MKINKVTEKIQLINEDVKKTPKTFVDETSMLMDTAEKQLSELNDTLNKLERKANSGQWYFSGMMQNDYGIKKNESIEELYEKLQNGLEGSTIYTVREIKKYLGWDKAIIQKIKNISL